MSKKRKSTRTSSYPSSRKPMKSTRKARQQSKIWLWIGLGAAALILIVLGVVLVLNNQSQAVEITVAQAYEKYQKGTFVLDVRTQEEWNAAHIDKTTLIPLDQLESKLDQLPKSEEIVIICNSGRRSKQAMAIMQKSGFKNVSSVIGGITEWQAAGYPVISSAP